MWFRCLLCFAIVPDSCAIAGPDLQKEDLRSIQQAFQKKDALLDWFWVTAKKPLDATRSVMIVQAAPTEEHSMGSPRSAKRLPVPGKTQIGVFVVEGTPNRVQLILDLFPNQEAKGFPAIGQLTLTSVNLHFYSDYGMYNGSIKYIYDLLSIRPPLRFRYGMLALTSSNIRKGKLVYSGSSSGRSSQVVIEPLQGNALPAYKITEGLAAESDSIRKPVSLRMPDGRLIEISDTPAGQPHQLAGFSLALKSGSRAFYPAPVPTMEINRKLRPSDQAPGEIENNIGPVTQEGWKLWFASSFYDGEGTSGVGAVGSFDMQTHKFEMRYLAKIAPWSGSAIRLDGDDLWIGLMRQPEGSALGGGLLRYNIKTAAVMKYDIPDYIYTIDPLGDAVYCGTSNGLYRVRGNDVMQMRFEPDARGEIIMVTSPK